MVQIILINQKIKSKQEIYFFLLYFIIRQIHFFALFLNQNLQKQIRRKFPSIIRQQQINISLIKQKKTKKNYNKKQNQQINNKKKEKKKMMMKKKKKKKKESMKYLKNNQQINKIHNYAKSVMNKIIKNKFFLFHAAITNSIKHAYKNALLLR
ncbi:transmembrane protein, putative (macronuclear) [Tetrahymena thermophila SB210]|uniref:Transmembrane protein, putative n=1 Tax=Tetrahymena thermophila (strain SB210) TaxID=312017 RepID=W7X6B0_TETTS|nr:transmembrane protein, putative [Tetrahymena thermophila SB210]EWS74905.1 transmembrane protein, putative [Tetrahymena thermophila SB210]|eukprot:XP_012652618.1 transmembrane protein, putative [Tetrahymena thermophila SB210]